MQFVRISFLLFTLFYFSIISLFAQDECNCELAPKLIPSIAKNFNSGNLDSAEYFIQQFNLSNKKICITNYLDGLAQVAISRKQYTKARDFLQNEFIIVQQLSCNKKPLIRYYNTLSKYYTENGFLDSTLNVALKVVELATQQNEKYALARANLNAGAVFSELKEYQKANIFFRDGYNIAIQQKDTTLICAALVRMSSNYYDLFEQSSNSILLDSVINTSYQTLTIARYPQDLIESMQAYSNISKYYSTKKMYLKSILYADTIIMKVPKGVHDFDRYLMLAFERKAEVFFEQSRYQEASIMADSALKYALLFNKQLSINALELLYKSSKKLSNPIKALWAYEQMVTTRDSIFSVKKNKAIQELEKKYNQTKNEKIISELSQQRKIYILCIVAAIAMIAVVVFYIRQQKLKHQQIVMETEQRLNRARMNPHFFFNTLASIQTFALSDADNKNLVANISKFSHIMRETLESTYKEYVTIEQEIDFLVEYLDLQKIRFPNRFNYNIHADQLLEIDELQIPSMIIQPFVENAIEHGLKGIDYLGVLNIQFNKFNNQLTIEINDNGVGLSTVTKDNGEHISRASQIIKDRIYLLNIKLKTKAGFIIDNNVDGKGVLVKINLPLLYK